MIQEHSLWNNIQWGLNPLPVRLASEPGSKLLHYLALWPICKQNIVILTSVFEANENTEANNLHIVHGFLYKLLSCDIAPLTNWYYPWFSYRDAEKEGAQYKLIVT